MSFCIFITWGVSIQFFIPIFFNRLKSYFAQMTHSASFVQMSPLKVLLGFIIRMQFTCLVRSRSRWFSGYLIWLSRKARQRRKRKGKKRIIIFCLPITPCSCSFPSLLLGPGLRYWRQTVSLLDAMWPRRNQWERTPVRKKISSKNFKLFKGDCTVNIKYNRTIIKLW